MAATETATAVADCYADIYDVRLKPKLLLSLINDHLPLQFGPIPDAMDLQKVVDVVKTFRLLSEDFPDQTCSKLVEDWMSSVHLWLDHVLALVSSPRADRCWIGVNLLGITFQECSSERFLASYAVWFYKLLPLLQPASMDCPYVLVASCIAMSDLFTRLAGFSAMRREGIAYAGRVIQPVQDLLNNDISDAVKEPAVQLLCTVINCFPSSLNNHYNSVESTVITNIVSGQCSSNVLKEYAHCLALLPKSKGDERSWFSLMSDILSSINDYLNDFFLGFEGAPQGTNPSTSSGGEMRPDGSSSHPSTRKSKQLLMSIVSTLMLTCCEMLTSSYPVEVNVPVDSLLKLVQRVLMVNGSIPQASLPFTTNIQQEFIFPEIPALHGYTLDLLAAITKGVQSQLLPYSAYITRLLKDYMKICASPEQRIKVYSIMRMLLLSMGLGIALCIAEELINNAFADLGFLNYDGSKESLCVDSRIITNEDLPQTDPKKRKVLGELSTNNSTSISVKIAALHALEALLNVGGAIRPESLRGSVDFLLISIAREACGGQRQSGHGNNTFRMPIQSAKTVDFQLAASRALLASLLSQSIVQPSYLYEGRELFHKGKQETGTKLADFCAHALLALEVLMHPRSIPLVEPKNDDSENEVLSSKSQEDMCLDDLVCDSTQTEMSDLYPSDDIFGNWFGVGENGTDQPPPSYITADLPETNIWKATNDHQAMKLPSTDSRAVEYQREVKEVLADLQIEERNREDALVETQQRPFPDPMLIECHNLHKAPHKASK